MAVCAKCKATIVPADINVGQNVAFCRACGEVQKLSDLSEAALANEPGRQAADFSNPPGGAWFREEGNELVFGASTRNLIAIFLVPFATVWIGGVLTFSTVIIAGTISGGAGPAGIFPLLFMVPFWIGGCFLFATVAMSLMGRVEVRLRGTQGEVFTGVGSIGRRRSFDLSEFDRVVEGQPWMNGPGMYGRISLEGKRRLTFGAYLNEERRYFLTSVLRSVIEGRD